MKIVITFVLMFLNVSMVFSGEDYSKIAVIESNDGNKIPYAELDVPKDTPFISIIDGDIANSPEFNDLLGMDKVSITKKVHYLYHAEKKETEFQLIYFNCKAINENKTSTKYGEIIGSSIDKPVRVVIAAKELSPYLVLQSTRFPVKYKEYYLFFPSFLFSAGSTSYFTFNYSDNIADPAKTMAAEALENPGFIFYPDMRFRFEFKLDDYPRELTPEEQEYLATYENLFYKKTGIMKYGNEVNLHGFKYVLCWQKGFNQYLHEEYHPSAPLWLYGNLVTYDAFKKVGYIFLRDFTLISVEEMVEQRLHALK